MKNEYLWDKTGNDPEIENLENALKVFRIHETKTPQIPNNVVQFKKESPRKVFPVFRALAAGFAFVFVLVGASFIYFNSQIETARHTETTNSVQSEGLKIQRSNDSVQTEKAGIEKISDGDKLANEFEKPKIKKQRFKVQKLIYKPKAKNGKVEQPQIVKLTEEEKEAYDKLMLALSITSSKLKIVKDKIQNLDEQTAINTENKINTKEK